MKTVTREDPCGTGIDRWLIMAPRFFLAMVPFETSFQKTRMSAVGIQASGAQIEKNLKKTKKKNKR